MALENLMNKHMENMEERVLSVMIPLDILRIVTKVMSIKRSTLKKNIPQSIPINIVVSRLSRKQSWTNFKNEDTLHVQIVI